MADTAFTKRFADIGDEVREAIKRARDEQAKAAAKERAKAEASARPHLEQLVERVEAAVRRGETHAIVLELEGEHALRDGHSGHWQTEPHPHRGSYISITEDLVRTALSPGAALAYSTLRDQKLHVTIHGPKEHPKLVIAVTGSV